MTSDYRFKYAAARSHRSVLRDDTIARHVDFIVPAATHHGVQSQAFVVTIEDLAKKQGAFATEKGVTKKHLSVHWQRHCLALYGEHRYWPGPHTSFHAMVRRNRHKYLNKEYFHVMTRQEIIEANRALHNFVPARAKREQASKELAAQALLGLNDADSSIKATQP